MQALTEDATCNHFETAKLFLSHGSRRDLKYKKTPDGVQALLEGLLIFQLLLVASSVSARTHLGYFLLNYRAIARG